MIRVFHFRYDFRRCREEEPECGLEQYLMTQLIIAGMFHYLVRKNDDILG